MRVEDMRVGQRVVAKLVGQWAPAVIEAISERGATVRFVDLEDSSFSAVVWRSADNVEPASVVDTLAGLA